MNNQVLNNLKYPFVVGGGVVCTNLQPISSYSCSSVNYHFVYLNKVKAIPFFSVINPLRASYYNVFNYFGYTKLSSILYDEPYDESVFLDGDSNSNLDVYRLITDEYREINQGDIYEYDGCLIIKSIHLTDVRMKVMFGFSKDALSLINYLITPHLIGHNEINIMMGLIENMQAMANEQFGERSNNQSIFCDGTMLAIDVMDDEQSLSRH